MDVMDEISSYIKMEVLKDVLRDYNVYWPCNCIVSFSGCDVLCYNISV